MVGDAHVSQSGALPGVQLRLARNDSVDAASFCKLFNSLYARKVDESYYRWQFFDTPFPSGIAVATTSDDAWTGCYGFHVQRAENLSLPLAWSLDIMVAPQFQRRGLFRELAQFAAAEAAKHNPAALCVMANANADRAHLGSLGWRRITPLLTFARTTSDLPASDPNFTTAFDQQFVPQLVAPIAAEFRTSLAQPARSEAYLHWRFLESPWYRYSTVLASNAHGSRAVAVIKLFRDPVLGKSFGDIVDIAWNSADPALLRELLIACLRYFRDAGVPTAGTWLQTNSILDAIGTDLGFAQTNQTRYFCSKVLDPEFSGLELASNWFLTMSAAEIF